MDWIQLTIKTNKDLADFMPNGQGSFQDDE